MKKRPVIFVCQPITPRSETENHAVEFLNNVRAGSLIAAELIRKGFSVYCPSTDMLYWLASSEPLTTEDIYEHDISLLLKMDAIFTVGDWSKSPNCRREMHTAWEANIPCFSQVDMIVKWKEEVFNANI